MPTLVRATWMLFLVALHLSGAALARAEEPIEWRVARHLEEQGRFAHAGELLRSVPADRLDARLASTREAWIQRLEAKHKKKIDADLAVIERLARAGQVANATALVLRVAEYGGLADVQRACAALAPPEREDGSERSGPAGERPGPAPSATAGVIRCAVRFDGVAPTPTRTDISGSEGCDCDEAVSEEVVVNDDGTLRHCIVWLDSSQFASTTFAAPAEAVEVEQHRCVFVPHVVVVQTGQPLVYKNSDAALHNVHGLATRNKAWNTAVPRGTSARPIKLRVEEIIAVKCDVHPWEASFVGAFPHPYHAVTADDGAAFIANVPPGEYALKVWQERYGIQAVKVVVKAGETTRVEVVVKGKDE
jgi:plastocyanin